MEKAKMDVGWFTLRLFWKMAPGKFVLELLTACLKNILNLINAVWLLQFVMERIGNSADFYVIVRVLCILAAANGLYCALNNWYKVCYKPRNDLEVKDKLAGKMAEKARHLPLRYYENAEFYSIVIRAQKGIDTSLFLLFDNIVQMAGFATGLIGAVVAMVRIDKFLLLFVLFAPPMLLAAKKQRAVMSIKKKELVPSQRRKAYAQSTWLVKEYAREFKTSDACKIPDKLYENAYNDSIAIHGKYRKKLFWLYILNRGLSINLIAIVCYAYAFARIYFLGDLSISAFSVLFVAIMNVLSKINKIANSYAKWGNYESDIRAIRLFRDLEPETEPEKPIIPGDFNSLEFRDVSFSYGEKAVFQNVSFKLEAGKKYAIVGYNGAGKTTLVKLILRFYDVEQGEILYNELNIKRYDLESYRSKIAAVFQDFYIFNLSLYENIFLAEQKGNEDELYAVLKALNAGELCGEAGNIHGIGHTQCLEANSFQGIHNVEGMSNSYRAQSTKRASDVQRISNTQRAHSTQRILGRKYDPDGIELSGGQKQKLAVARALCKDAEITIMDEPSAALDPVSASQMMDYIMQKCNGKTLIMISHQMSVVKNMDKVLMFGEGGLTGFGTHEELFASNEIYAEFYSCQAEMYSHF